MSAIHAVVYLTLDPSEGMADGGVALLISNIGVRHRMSGALAARESRVVFEYTTDV